MLQLLLKEYTMDIYPNNFVSGSFKIQTNFQNKTNNTYVKQTKSQPAFKGGGSFYNAENLVNSLKRLYGDYDNDNLFAKIISLVSKNRNTIIGNSGSNARFFNIPFINNFGLRVKLPVTYTFNIANSAQFRTIQDLFPDENFGQAVFSNGNGITFSKKVDGVPASIDNWYYFYCNKNKITRRQALEYYDRIVKLSKLPDVTYENFARKIKLITDTNPRLLDFSSPNNLIIDFKSQEITPVDVADTGYEAYHSMFHRMYNSLIDKDLNPLFMKNMHEEEIEKCLSCYDAIGEKLFDAINYIA